MVVLKSVLRPSRFGFGNRSTQIACESSLNSDNANFGTSCVTSSQKEHDEKDADGYNGSHPHAGREGGNGDSELTSPCRTKKLQLQRKPSSSRRVRGLWNEGFLQLLCPTSDRDHIRWYFLLLDAGRTRHVGHDMQTICLLQSAAGLLGRGGRDQLCQEIIQCSP